MAIRIAVLLVVALSGSAVLQMPEDQLSLIEYGSRKRLSKIMANMTIHEALTLVPSLPKKLRQHLQHKLKKVSFLKRSDSDSTEGEDSSAGMGEQGVEEARKLLNDMGTEAEVGLDAEKIRCSELLDKQAKALTASRNELNNYNSQAAAARGRILEAQDIISGAQRDLPVLEDELAGHRKKCSINIAELEKQLKTARGDQEVIAGILPKTKCNSALLQCEQVGDYSDVSFRNPALHNQMSLLQNTAVRKLVRQTFNSIGGDTEGVVRKVNNSRKQLHRNPKKVAAPGPAARAKSQARCSIRNNPNCQNLRDKFLMMQGEIIDLVTGLEKELADTDASCSTTENDFMAQIADAEAKLNDAQTVLAQSTKAELSAQEQCRLLDASIAELESEERQISSECEQSLSDIEMEICGVKQIRTELYKMSSMAKYIQDCVVSEWTADECSVSCEGGTQKITRTVLVPADMGMKCPPLAASRTCNDFTCPLDCVLEDWTGWSGCSAECGGGVKQRVRGIIRHPAHGGEPCGPTSDSEACKTQSCDIDCVLSDWSPWSNCSKECDVGSTVRVKGIVTPPAGAGWCAEDDSEERLERKECNANPCKAKAKDGILKCKAMLDVVLLLDSSGSIGEAGWAATKQVGTTIVKAFKTGAADAAQISVLEFSGPRTWAAYYKCMDGTTTDFVADCNIKWLNHWSTESEKIAAGIESATWFKASTLTSAALAMAEAEITSGRRDARKLTIVVTDGRPLSNAATRSAALSLRSKSRLMFVPVGRNAPVGDIRRWATQPFAENVVMVRDFDDLKGKETINRIIADSCPDLDGGA